MQPCSSPHGLPAYPPRPARKSTPAGAGEQSGGRRRCGLTDVFVRHSGVFASPSHPAASSKQCTGITKRLLSGCQKYSINASEYLGREC